MSVKSKLELRISEIRTELREVAGSETLTPELREKATALKTELADCEVKLQAAILAETDPPEPGTDPPDPLDAETRERLALRKKVNLLGFFQGCSTGKLGAEYREYQSACGAGGTDIPFDLFEGEPEKREATPAPSTGTGVNVQRIVPKIFANSAASMLLIDMPRVGSGTSSWLRITTDQSAGWQATGGAQAATAGALSSVSTSPHRISARLEINAEAIAEIGTAQFSSQLQSNLMMVLSNALDKSLLNGAGSSNEITGLIPALNSISALSAETTTNTWLSAFQRIVANSTDGVFAKNLSECGVLLNVETARYFDSLFDSTVNGNLPRMSLAAHLKNELMSYGASAQMPAATSDVATGILCRKGMPGEQLAVAPIWSQISITDIYSGSASAQTSYNLHVLVGDVLVLQPNGYELLSFKLA